MPGSSRTLGSMSRGTAMSIRSSGRPRAAPSPTRAPRGRRSGAATTSRRRRCPRCTSSAGRSRSGPPAAEALRQADRAVVAAVGHEHCRNARRRRASAVSSPFSPAPPRATLRVEVAQHRLRQLTATRATDTRERPIAGLRAHALAGGERVAEEAVGDRARDALHERELVRALHLALHLGLPDDHGVEAGGDAEEVPHRVEAAERSRCARAARWGGCSPGGRGRRAPRSPPPPGRRPRGTAPCGCRWRWPRPRGSRRAATSSASTLAARPSGSASRSRSATGAVLCETPSASRPRSSPVLPDELIQALQLALHARHLRRR